MRIGAAESGALMKRVVADWVVLSQAHESRHSASAGSAQVVESPDPWL